MNSIRIGFSTPKSFNPISWLVRKATGSTCSHVWFTFVDETCDLAVVLEAHELGYRLIPLSRFEKENNVVAIIQPRVDMTDALRWSVHWLGTAYDFGGLLGMTWVLIGRMLKKRWHNPAQNSHAMFCSEMAVTMLHRAGYPGSKALVAADTSPQDLLDFLQPAP